MASSTDRRPSEAPAPFIVYYSPWKVGAMALGIAILSTWWTWRGIDALSKASEKTFHLWFTPALGIVLTLGILGGILAQFRGRTEVIVVNQTGLMVPDLYEDLIPWRAVGGMTVVRGRGVVFEVTDGASYGRQITRNVRASNKPGKPDMACIRSGLLDQSTAAILARLQAHQAHQVRRSGPPPN